MTGTDPDDPDGPGGPGEDGAVEAFEELGLTGYEAKVFIALHRLGSGTARDVSRTTDVPRSQVYSAAESLADRGLVGVQQSSPMRYKPVSVEAARSTLQDRFDRESDRAFGYVESVRREGGDERREELWTLRGGEAVSDRAAELAGEAERRAVYGTGDPAYVTDGILAALRGRAEAGVDVTVVTEDERVAATVADDPGIAVVEPPPYADENDRAGRVLLVDRDVILLSVVEVAADPPEGETAVWSAHTTFAEVLIQLVQVSMGIAE